MNEEMLKTTLLEIIKEADNLPESELEIIPGTRFRVKKGRVDEFKANARFYYLLTKKQKINGDQYLSDVYYELSDELARDREKYISSKVSDLYDLGKDELAKLEQLKTALSKQKQELEKIKKREEELNEEIQRKPEKWKEANEVQAERQEIENTITRLNGLIIEATIELKDKVNDEVKNITVKEMEFLRNQLTTVNKGVATSWGLDGHNILKKDEEYYNNLWFLSNILDNVKDNLPLINVGDTIWVNPEQLASAQELVSKIDYLRLVKKEEKEAVVEHPNDKLIAEISTELDNLRSQTNPASAEVDRLTKILEYLHAAKYNEFALTPVWNIAYVNGPDREAFIKLLRESSFFQKYNPDLKLREKNEKLILELRKYISGLEENYNQKARESLTNVSGINYQNHIILESDKKELENILAVISILENAKNDLIELSIGGCVPSNIIPGYKKLISEIRYFTPKEEEKSLSSENEKLTEEKEKSQEQSKPNIDPLKANKELAEKLKLMLDNLNPEDKKKADLFARMCEILTTVDLTKKVINLSDNFGGIILNEEQGKEFQQIVQEIDNLTKEPDKEIIDLSIRNQDEITKIKNEMAQLLVFGKVMPEHQKEYELLENQLNILSMSVPVDELKEINGVTISSEKEEEYLKILSDLENLRKPTSKGEEKFELGIMEEKKKILKWSEENKDILENSEETIKVLQEQISMLENASKKDDSLYLSKEDSTLFYELDKKLPFIYGIISNESLVEQLEREIAKADPKENPKEHGFLNAQLEVLKKFKYLNYQTAIKIEGAYIPLEYARGYIEILKNIKQARENPPKRINEAIILETKNKMQSLLVDGEIPENNREEYILLSNKLIILESADRNNELEEVEGAKVPKQSKEEYLEILNNLKNIEEKKRGTSPNIEPPKQPTKFDKIKRRLVKSIRKPKALEWWKKHKKVVIGIGLAILLVASLSSLMPAILYANSCLAASMPVLAPGLNAINATIMNGLGISLGSLNFTASAANLAPAILSGLASIGGIGLGAAGMKMLYNQHKQANMTRLPDPSKKDLIEKVKGLGASIISKTKELGRSLPDKATELHQNVSDFIDEKRKKRREDKLYKEASANIEQIINSEKERIEERYENIKREQEEPVALSGEVIEVQKLSSEEEDKIRKMMAQAIDVPYRPVTIPTNEEIAEALEENLGRGR